MSQVEVFAEEGQITETTEESTKDLYTVSEIARRLRVDDTTVRRWIKNGALEAVTLPHIGKRTTYRVRERTLNTILG